MASRALDPDSDRGEVGPRGRAHLRPRRQAPAAGVLVALPALAFVTLPDDAPRWLVMWALAFAMFFAGKLVIWLHAMETASPADRAGLLRHAAWFLAWPGMNARAFLFGATSPADKPGAAEWRFAISKAVAGFACLAIAAALAFHYPHASAPAQNFVGWLGMVSVVTAAHFGLFHVASCAWRACGVAALPIMREPLLSESVGDFWSRRWNLAFRDLAHRCVFVPVARVSSAQVALFASFFVSGLAHELVITVPAQAGFGGPTAFFMLQACAIAFERSRLGLAAGLKRPWRGRMFAALVLLAPLPLLFPPAFVTNVVLPWLRTLAAIVA